MKGQCEKKWNGASPMCAQVVRESTLGSERDNKS
jgi:hypothetical protein